MEAARAISTRSSNFSPAARRVGHEQHPDINSPSDVHVWHLLANNISPASARGTLGSASVAELPKRPGSIKQFPPHFPPRLSPVAPPSLPDLLGRTSVRTFPSQNGAKRARLPNAAPSSQLIGARLPTKWPPKRSHVTHWPSKLCYVRYIA